MSDEERTGTCVVCMTRDPLPDLAPVCGPCRSRLAGQLRDIPALVDELRDPPGADPDAPRSDDLRYPPGHENAGKVVPLAAELIPAGAVRGQSSAPRVRGSRDAPVPIRVDVVDLLAEADERTVHDTRSVPIVQVPGDPEWVAARMPGRDDGEVVWQEVRRRELVRTEKTFHCRCGRPELHADQPARPVVVPAQDQTGHVSAATILHGWCRDFAETRRETEPPPTPAAQCRYLADRLDWAFTTHPAVDEFAGEVGDLWHTLRRAAGLTEPKDELVQGVPCRSITCDLKTLWRLPGAQWVECKSCGNLLTEPELQDWIKMLRAPLCGKRNGEWWCSLAKKHDGPCAPYEGESAA